MLLFFLNEKPQCRNRAFSRVCWAQNIALGAEKVKHKELPRDFSRGRKHAENPQPIRRRQHTRSNRHTQTTNTRVLRGKRKTTLVDHTHRNPKISSGDEREAEAVAARTRGITKRKNERTGKAMPSFALPETAAAGAESRGAAAAAATAMNIGSPLIQPRCPSIPESPIFVVSSPRGSR